MVYPFKVFLQLFVNCFDRNCLILVGKKMEFGEGILTASQLFATALLTINRNRTSNVKSP